MPNMFLQRKRICCMHLWNLFVCCQYLTLSVIIRDRYGDKFETQNCNSGCLKENAYCSPPNMCKCNFSHKTYFKVKENKPGCVSGPDEMENCEFYITDISSKSRKSHFYLINNKILGELNHARKLKNCKIDLGNYWIKYSQWGNLFDGRYRTSEDFKIITQRTLKTVHLKFFGNDTIYAGMLIKFQISCTENIHSCVIFKSNGEMKMITKLDYETKTYNDTNNDTTNLAKEPKEKKNFPKWMLGTVIGLCFFALLILTISCIYCFMRKKDGIPEIPCCHKTSQRPRGNTLTGTALLSIDHKGSIPNTETIQPYKTIDCADDAVYLDPDVIFETQQKPKENNYDYAYMNSRNMKNKIKNSSGNDDVASHEYADISPKKVEHPYADPDNIPCPESRKSIGYAILDGAANKTVQNAAATEYQMLLIKNEDLMKKKDDDGDDDDDDAPDSTNYFQLEDSDTTIKNEIAL